MGWNDSVGALARVCNQCRLRRRVLSPFGPGCFGPASPLPRLFPYSRSCVNRLVVGICQNIWVWVAKCACAISNLVSIRLSDRQLFYWEAALCALQRTGILEHSFDIVLVLQISSHSYLVACYIVRLLHQLRGAFRSRLDYTFERFGVPNVTSHGGQYTNRCSLENIPHNTRVEFNFGWLWISILIQSRLDVERREYARDDNVQGPESKLSARTGPRDTIINHRGKCD